MDKKDKKKALKAEKKIQARALFPLKEAELMDLFDFLDVEFQKHGCDHTHRLTTQWIQETGYPEQVIIQWLEDTGGYCDCEVLANSYDHFMQNKNDA